MKFNPDDPKWTAYVLGEIEESERAALERELEVSAEAREFVEELRLTSVLMKERLAAEAAFGLTSGQRAVITASRERRKPWFARPPVWGLTAVAASLALGVALTRSLVPSQQALDAPRTAETESATVLSQKSDDTELRYEQVAPTAAKGATAQARLQDFSKEAAAASGNVRGVARDASNAVIPGVTVRVQNSQTRATTATVTSERGEYELKNLPPGNYDVTAELPGFQTARSPSVAVSEKQEARLDFELQVGQLAASVAVAVVADMQKNAEPLMAPFGPVPAPSTGNLNAPLPAPAGSETALGQGPARSVGLSGVFGGVLRAPAAFALPAAPPPLPSVGADGIVSPRPNNEAYDRIADSGFIAVSQQQLATFSSDVDTAAYANVRRFITQNQWPPADAVRIEEMINYFSYDYPQAAGPHPITANVETAAAPWNPQHRLVRIGIKAKDVQMGRKPSNLVFLIDVSASMRPAERLPLLKSGLRMLVDRLSENDTVSIVVYAGASGVALQPVSGEKKEVINRAIENLQSGGSTNGAAGIQLAYDLAVSNFIQGGINRVILATDGDFNVGVTNQGDLLRLIEERAKSGVFLTVLGFGIGNLKDSTLEMLADKGNGNYAYIDSLNEARKVLVEEMGSTLVTIAKDVKLQVEFNPAQVTAYRLIGYENRVLRAEDFNNDAKDAGDMGAGHTVTALFEVVPRGVKLEGPGIDPLRYQQAPATPLRNTQVSNEMLVVKVRYKEPEGSESKLLEMPLMDRGTSFSNAGTDFRFAASVAAFGMILRDSPYKGSATLDWVMTSAANSRGADRNGYREEFIRLVQRAMQMGPRR